MCHQNYLNRDLTVAFNCKPPVPQTCDEDAILNTNNEMFTNYMSFFAMLSTFQSWIVVLTSDVLYSYCFTAKC